MPSSFISLTDLGVDPIGCYGDVLDDPAFRIVVHKSKFAKRFVQNCAKKAAKKGFKIFGVKKVEAFYQCVGDKDVENRYNMHGESSSCVKNVGQSTSMFVYRITGESHLFLLLYICTIQVM